MKELELGVQAASNNARSLQQRQQQVPTPLSFYRSVPLRFLSFRFVCILLTLLALAHVLLHLHLHPQLAGSTHHPASCVTRARVSLLLEGYPLGLQKPSDEL